MPLPSKEQAEVYVILVNLALKTLFSISVIIINFIIIYAIFHLNNWSQTVPLSILEAVLTGTVYVAFKHYFPSGSTQEKSTDTKVADS